MNASGKQRQTGNVPLHLFGYIAHFVNILHLRKHGGSSLPRAFVVIIDEGVPATALARRG